MILKAIRSDEIYLKIINSKEEDRNDIFRYELMKPFEFKYKCIGASLKAEDGGYDVISAITMGGGYNPRKISKDNLCEVNMISDDNFWNNCYDSIKNTIESFEKNNIKLPIKEYVFTILLNDPNNPMSRMTSDYCGDGGIPGYIIGTIIPNENSLKMLPVALCHEANHNVRWQFNKWSNNVTLADMIISEGIAENHAALMYGEDKIGKWVTSTDNVTLTKKVNPMIKENLFEKDFNKISQFLYGDEIMKLRGQKGIGMPYCGGYACGYNMIKHYMKKTGKTIYETTITSTEDILKEMEDYFK